MPFALAAALLASLGLHAAALFVPEVEPAAVPESATLSVEIVVRPHAAPAVAGGNEAGAKLPSSHGSPPRSPRRLPPPAVVAAPVKPSAVAADEMPAESVAVAGAGPADEAGSRPAPAAGEYEQDGSGGTGASTATADLTSPQLPASGEIRYVVYRGELPTMIGRAVQRWEMSAGRYRLHSVMETTGVAAWLRNVRLETESSGELAAGGLVPTLYVSRRRDGERERSERVVFDHDAGVVRFGNGTTAVLPAGAQDLLSFNYQLGWLVRSGEMAIASGRKLASYRLELLGKEWLEAPAGPIWTLHFRASGATITEVWLAPDNYLLPVKIRHVDKKGESFEQVAESVSFDSE